MYVLLALVKLNSLELDVPVRFSENTKKADNHMASLHHI